MKTNWYDYRSMAYVANVSRPNKEKCDADMDAVLRSLPARGATPKDPDNERLKREAAALGKKKVANKTEWKVGDKFTFEKSVSVVPSMEPHVGKVQTVCAVEEKVIAYRGDDGLTWVLLFEEATKIEAPKFNVGDVVVVRKWADSESADFQWNDNTFGRLLNTECVLEKFHAADPQTVKVNGLWVPLCACSEPPF